MQRASTGGRQKLFFMINSAKALTQSPRRSRALADLPDATRRVASGSSARSRRRG